MKYEAIKNKKTAKKNKFFFQFYPNIQDYKNENDDMVFIYYKNSNIFFAKAMIFNIAKNNEKKQKKGNKMSGYDVPAIINTANNT